MSSFRSYGISRLFVFKICMIIRTFYSNVLSLSQRATWNLFGPDQHIMLVKNNDDHLMKGRFWTVSTRDRWRREVKMDTLSLRSNLVFLRGDRVEAQASIEVLLWGVFKAKTSFSVFHLWKEWRIRSPQTEACRYKKVICVLCNCNWYLYLIIQLEVENPWIRTSPWNIVKPC